MLGNDNTTSIDEGVPWIQELANAQVRLRNAPMDRHEPLPHWARAQNAKSKHVTRKNVI
jgi:hypothetical protein